MRIEIHGAQLKNKGAQKMLRVVVHELRKRISDCQFFCDPVCGSRADLKVLGVDTFGFSRGWMGGRLYRAKLLVQRVLGVMNIGTQVGDMDALIDVSGFAYSDQWGVAPCRDGAALAEYYRKRNKPVVFLPQAFGPFRESNLQASIVKLVDNADVVWARDHASFKYLRRAVPHATNLKLAPDITQLISPCDGVIREVSRPYKLAIVPNVRVAGTNAFPTAESYCNWLASAADFEIFDEVTIFIHDDSGNDLDLVASSPALKHIPRVSLSDAVELKAALGEYHVLFGSRYHALVAALSQGIPVIAVGWSHKYEELMKAYDLTQYCFTTTAFDLEALFRRLLSPDIYRGLSSQISAINQANEEALLKLWDEVSDSLLP